MIYNNNNNNNNEYIKKSMKKKNFFGKKIIHIFKSFWAYFKDESLQHFTT